MTCRDCDRVGTVPCAVCGGRLAHVLCLGDAPIANRLRASQTDPVDRHPLHLAACLLCATVQLVSRPAPETLFDGAYPYRSSQARGMVASAGALADRLTAALALTGRHLVAEVGSNDGYLLRHYAHRGVRVLGFDPVADAAADAQQHGIPTETVFFDRKTGRAHTAEAAVVHANNVLAHVDDPDDLVEGMAAMLTPDGLLVVETPSLADLVATNAWDTCMPPEELIVTEKGLRPIGDIAVGDRVLTHHGRWRSVTRTSRRPYDGPMRVVRPWGQLPVRMTPEHPLWLDKRDDVRRRQRQERHHLAGSRSAPADDACPRFVPAGEVAVGDAWLMPLIHEESAPTDISVTTWSSGRGSHLIDTTFDITRSLMMVFGFFLAEGSYHLGGRNGRSHSVQFAFGKSESELRLAQDCVEALTVCRASASIRLTKFGWHVQTCGPMAALLFDQCGTGESKKRLPSWALSLPQKLAWTLLESYMQGDGYVYRDGRYLRGSSVSRALAYGIALVANKLGFPASVSKSQREGPIQIANNPRPTLSPLPVFDILVPVAPKSTRVKHWIEGEWHCRNVRSIETEQYVGDVCNLEVEEDNSYCTPAGAVHNCYHEHRYYWTAATVARLLARHDLHVAHLEHLPDLHGGTLRVFASKRQAWSIEHDTAVAREERAGFGGQRWAERFAIVHAAHVETIRGWWDLHHPVAGYTASAKATVLLHVTGVPAPGWIVDSTLVKQGRWAPAGSLVLPPAELERRMPADCVVFSWNWAGEVARRAAGYVEQGGRLWRMVPRPERIG